MLGDHLVFPILLSTDLAKSREFYHDTLGLDIVRQDEERIIFRCGSGSQLAPALRTALARISSEVLTQAKGLDPAMPPCCYLCPTHGSIRV